MWILGGAGSSWGGGNPAVARGVGVDPAKVWSDYQRPAEYAGVVAEDVFITAADGTQLAARLTRPAGDDGEAVSEPLPVILTITGYNARLISTALRGNHFGERGYAHLYVDERGTGSSGGTWLEVERNEPGAKKAPRTFLPGFAGTARGWGRGESNP